MLRALHRLFQRAVAEDRCAGMARLVAGLLPDTPLTLLDIGCGSGAFASLLSNLKPNLHITGVEVTHYPACSIPVQPYNGVAIPFADNAFDYALLINVLHHADDAAPVLHEARRIARKGIVIKDHYCNSRLDFYTLMLMDIVGNAFVPVPMPYNYLSEHQWTELFRQLQLKVSALKTRFISYNNSLLNRCFGRNLHFIALVEPLSNGIA